MNKDLSNVDDLTVVEKAKGESPTLKVFQTKSLSQTSSNTEYFVYEYKYCLRLKHWLFVLIGQKRVCKTCVNRLVV